MNRYLTRKACASFVARLGFVAIASGLISSQSFALSLEQVEQQALDHQPQLRRLNAQSLAATARAVQARQLPDAKLTAGVQNLPANGQSAFDIGDDFMTMTGVSLMQEFPTREKRQLRGEAEALRARELDARAEAVAGAIRRDVALVFVDAWRAQRALELTDVLIKEAHREDAASEIALRSSQILQAGRLESRVQLEWLKDRRLSLQQSRESALARLSRWTGLSHDDAELRLVEDLEVLPSLERLVAGIGQHPELVAADADIAARENAVALAKADYWPDWRLEVGYAWRPEYSEMAMVQVGIDLPVLPGRRQDKSLAAAQAEASAVHAMHVDHARSLIAQATSTYRNWASLIERIEHFDQSLLPAAKARVGAALAAYRAGEGEMIAVLRARRDALDAELMRLDLDADRLRNHIRLRYLAQPGEGA